MQVLVGDWAGREVADNQPTKLAAFEGLPRTEAGAPFHLGGFYSDGEVKLGITVPRLLSLLADARPERARAGARRGPGARPAAGQRRAHRVPDDGRHRDAAGAARRGLRRDVVARAPAAALAVVLAAVVAAGPLSLVALICGWVVTEVGRQPWVVYQHLRTRRRRDATPSGLPSAFAGMAPSTWPVQASSLAAAAPVARADGGLMAQSGPRPGRPRADRLRRAGRRGLRRRVLGPDRRRPARGGRIRGLVIVVDDAGLGGQPRVAAVRARGPVDGVPAVLLVDHVHAVRAGAARPGGIVFRGAAFALRGHARTINEGRVLGGCSRSPRSSCRSAWGPSRAPSASGRVPPGNAAGEPFGSWLAPTPIALGVVTVAAGAFLAAVFMFDDAERRDLADVAAAMRRRALWSGASAGALALAALLVVRSDARELFDGLTSGLGLVCVLLSGACGVATMALVAAGRGLVARFVASGAVAFIVLGWVAAQSPYLLPGELTLDQAAAPSSTLVAVFVTFCAGAVILVPSLVLLYRLMLRGQLDKDYAPADEALR